MLRVAMLLASVEFPLRFKEVNRACRNSKIGGTTIARSSPQSIDLPNKLKNRFTNKFISHKANDFMPLRGPKNNLN